MLNYYYKDSIQSFLKTSTEAIIGQITVSNPFDSTVNQNKSWEIQIPILKTALHALEGTLFFEFSIPRMGKRVDVLVIIENVVFVIEFKVGEQKYLRNHVEQVWDYALDLKNFHAPSHHAVLAPILVATEARQSFLEIFTSHQDHVLAPIKANKAFLQPAIMNILHFFQDEEDGIIDGELFSKGSYAPTPTIIEAAVSLYNNHTVDNITRSDATAKNLTVTASAISNVIHTAKSFEKKIICFVTGVPGAGKTLVGLKVATSHLDEQNGNASVYLSGNAPLVAILQEALARDKVKNEKAQGRNISKNQAKAGVKAFIQIIHHYRDAYLVDPNPPYDHVAIFDEAQRAWNKEQTAKFMKQKKGHANFDDSEPEFLISCLDRHKDWAVIICLLGGGQEINTGEAGISEWLNAIKNKYSHWEVHISPNLTDSEYTAINSIEALKGITSVHLNPDLHLAVSMRSFRAENLSIFVKQLLDLNREKAIETLQSIADNYPIVLTRDLAKANGGSKKKQGGAKDMG